MILRLTVHGDPGAWRRLGLDVGADGAFDVGTTGFDVVARDPAGLVAWTILGADPNFTTVDGLPTTVLDADRVPAQRVSYHVLPVRRVDHVVVVTPSLERTCTAIAAATGAPLKRIREVGGGVRQGFHRMGEVIVEVVERPDIPADSAAMFWGLAFAVDDLEAATGRLGRDLLGPLRPAVQPGRLIATVRESAGLGVPLALMTPG